MAEQRKRKPKKPQRTYVHRPNAVCVTIHSQDGRPVPKAVLDEAATAVTNVALQHRLLISLAEA